MGDKIFPETIYVTYDDEGEFLLPNADLNGVAVIGEVVAVAVYRRVEMGTVSAAPQFLKN